MVFSACFVKEMGRPQKFLQNVANNCLAMEVRMLSFCLMATMNSQVIYKKIILVADILKRPHCGFVVSSHPHASVKLREDATVRVDISGFAEEERKLYIEHSLKGYPQKVKELTNYLDSHLTINGLCYVPFIMVALLYLYNQGIPLPSNSVELYHRFITLTICRHLVKSGHPLDNKITDLAEPCNTIVK